MPRHCRKFRALALGYVHLWIVKFGEILEKTLQSEDVQSAFDKLTKADGESLSEGMILKFNLVDYKFEGFEAKVELQIIAVENGTVIFDEKYFETGTSTM